MIEWYAVQFGDDTDCGFGSFDYDKAVSMAREEYFFHPGEEARIVVCSNGTDYVEREIILRKGTR